MTKINIKYNCSVLSGYIYEIDIYLSLIMSEIINLHAREIIDSQGCPTIEVEVTTICGVFRSAVPSGVSTGTYEACELRDKDETRYFGKGVMQAVQYVTKEIAPALIEKSVTDQVAIDKILVELDGTHNKNRLGANTLLGVSMAVSKAGAVHAGLPLYMYLAKLIGNKTLRIPVPYFNIINGGKHADNALPFQEFMIAPTRADNFAMALQMGCEVYNELRKIIIAKYGKNAANVGDEGGFVPPIKDIEEPIHLILEAIQSVGYSTNDFAICINCAASEMWNSTEMQYDMTFKSGTSILWSSEKLQSLYESWCKKYSITSIEDPFDQDDWESWTLLTATLPSNVQVVGGNLTVTNIKRIHEALDRKACNALLLKMNQIGTVTEAIQAAQLCMKNNWNIMISHRSGETEDTYIANLAVAMGCGQIKTGAPCRGERTCKLNQILRIEEDLGNAPYGCIN